MSDTVTGEPVEDVLRIARQRYPVLTDAMFKKWRDRGLVPRPVRRPGRGKERGRGAIYPEGTTDQLVRVLEMRAERGRFDPDRALWRLWWEGWKVELERVRLLLEVKQDAWEQALFDFWDEWEESDLAAISPFTEHRLPIVALGQPKRRAGRDRFGSLMTLVLTVMSGRGTEWFQDANGDDDEEDLHILISTLGLRRPFADFTPRERASFGQKLGASFNRFSEAVSPPVLRETLTPATDADVIAARDELKTLASFARDVLRVSEWFIGHKTAGHDILTMSGKDADELAQGAVLVWLSLRRVPAYAALFDELRRHPDIASELRHAIENEDSTRSNRPPRARQRSGGTARRGNSPCSTSLASPYPPPGPDMVS